MKTAIHAFFALVLLASSTLANGDDREFREFGNFGGLGRWFDEDHHGFGSFGGLGLGFGLGFFDAERVQNRFESQFDSLQTRYDEGVANVPDFFTTTQYDRIVSKTERLDERYGLFLGGVERSIDRISDLISITNDDITYFNNLLADFQADTDVSPARLERIEAWINRITDRLTTRVDSLTNKQSTLQTNLPTYQTFQMDIDTFLTAIQAAGGGATDAPASGLVSLASSSKLVKRIPSSDQVTSAISNGALTPTSVPEPATAMLLVLACGAEFVSRAWRSRRQA